jgi:transposase
MKKQRKTYTKAFKLETIRLYEHSDKSAAAIEHDLDLPAGIVHKWRSRLAGQGQKAFVGKGHQTELEAEARGFAEMFHKQFVVQLDALDAELQSVEIETCGPALVGTIKGHTPDEHARTAARLGDELKLDFLVYGTIQRRSDTFLEFQPELFVQAVNIEETIGGAYTFGAPITFSESREDQRLVNKELKRRTSALLLTTRGLTLHLIGDYEGAIQFFETANDNAPGTRPAARELSHG